MPAGSRDFNVKTSTDPSVEITDLGENASRINGTVGSRYRSGHWIFSDDFEKGTAPTVRWVEGWGAGGTLAWDTASAWGGAQSLKMSTTAVLNNAVMLYRSFPLYPTRMGMECMFRVNQLVSYNLIFRMYWNRSLNIQPSAPNGGHDMNASLQIVSDNTGALILQLLEANGGGGAFVTRSSPLQINNSITSAWHSIKFVVDFTTGNWSWVWLDYLKFDFSAYKVAGSDGGTGGAANNQGQWIITSVFLQTTEAVIKTANIDDFVFTGDEP